MSRTGKKPISVPEKVKVNLVDGVIAVEGPLGKERVSLNPHTEVTVDKNQVIVKRQSDTVESRSMHGMMRSLIANAVSGVSQGFKKDLEINGVGYRAETKGNQLKLTLGFSHVVDYPLPAGIKVAVQDQTKMTVSGSDKELVGRVAAKIRSFRPPEPYKGKGIKYADEVIIRKVGKAAGGK